MSWDVDYENEDSIALAHEDGFACFAKRGQERDGHTEWTIELIDTDDGTELVRETHLISNEQHLWSVIENYTDLYPA
ncbi:hypothetical protein [Natronococcus occultus]|uniref:Uncharacterized protein n=1 Tax=Natronococcus occultus SP4 TaxID=694430 RepID=L0K4S9_9EURY|nr:hypothetical protein [Natronococcus occultus]AGB39354.1 hypothetical protein Natoc_3638 [Natronococcus occultus SP4]